MAQMVKQHAVTAASCSSGSLGTSTVQDIDCDDLDH